MSRRTPDLIRPDRNANWRCIAVAYLLLIFCPLAILSLIYGGVTWDEALDFEGANGAFWHAINTIKGLNPDLSTITYDLEYYGNATRWPAYLIWRLLAVHPWEFAANYSREFLFLTSGYVGISHVSVVLYGLLGVLLTGLLSNLISRDRFVVITASFSLAVLPAWLGHSFMNAKDIPFSVAYLLYTFGTTFYFTSHRQSRCVRNLYDSHIPRILGIGLMVGSRIGGIVFVLLTEFVIACLTRGSLLKKQVLSLFSGLALAWLVTPQSWLHPFQYSFKALSHASALTVSADRLEIAKYLFLHLSYSLPLFLLIGCSLFIYYVFYRHRFASRPILFLPIFLQTTLPFALLLMSGKTTYDGLRHLTFVFPGVCLFSAIGLRGIWHRSSSQSVLKSLVLIFTAISLALVIVDDFLMAPYQYVYKSDWSRALSHVSSSEFTSDYWGFSIRELFVGCKKSSDCSSVLKSFPLSVSDSDWNHGLVTAFSDLLSIKTVGEPPKDGSEPFLVISTFSKPSECKRLHAVSRRTVFSWPKASDLSSLNICNVDG